MKSIRDPDAWFRQPILWVGAVILVATLLGCVHMIVLASRYADTPVPVASPQR